MYLTRPNNPVRHDYNGPALVVKDLEVYCNSMTANMASIEQEIYNVRHMVTQERKLNAQLVDFATWVVTHNPKAINEYKAVTAALNAIESGGPGDEVQAVSNP